jgi:hypothetical protein
MKNRWIGAVFCSFLLLGSIHAMAPRSSDRGSVALRFIQAHLAQSNGEVQDLVWVQSNPNVTDQFKAALTKHYGEALAEDPDYGYGADAIIGGQDFADSYRVESCVVDGHRARVVLAGKDPHSAMKINVELVQVQGRWLVDASGDLIKR